MSVLEKEVLRKPLAILFVNIIAFCLIFVGFVVFSGNLAAYDVLVNLIGYLAALLPFSYIVKSLNDEQFTEAVFVCQIQVDLMYLIFNYYSIVHKAKLSYFITISVFIIIILSKFILFKFIVRPAKEHLRKEQGKQ